MVTVGRRRQGEGQGDHRLARRVEQLDLAALEVLPQGEGVDPRASSQVDARGRVRGLGDAGLAIGESRIRRETEGMSSEGVNSRAFDFGKEKKTEKSMFICILLLDVQSFFKKKKKKKICCNNHLFLAVIVIESLRNPILTVRCLTFDRWFALLRLLSSPLFQLHYNDGEGRTDLYIQLEKKKKTRS